MKKFSIYAVFVISFFAMISCIEPPWDDGRGGGGGGKDTIIIDTIVRDTVIRDTSWVKGIVGEWNWDYSFGGIGGVRQSPKTVGYTLQYIFNEDGTYFKLMDNQIVEMGQYTYGKGYSQVYGKEAMMLELFNPKASPMGERFLVDFSADGSTLSLTDDYVDGMVHSYSRLK